MDDPFDLLTGDSPAMAEVRRLGRLAAGARATVLLLGALAQEIHRAANAFAAALAAMGVRKGDRVAGPPASQRGRC